MVQILMVHDYRLHQIIAIPGVIAWKLLMGTLSQGNEVSIDDINSDNYVMGCIYSLEPIDNTRWVGIIDR